VLAAELDIFSANMNDFDHWVDNVQESISLRRRECPRSRAGRPPFPVVPAGTWMWMSIGKLSGRQRREGEDAELSIRIIPRLRDAPARPLGEGAESLAVVFPRAAYPINCSSTSRKCGSYASST
jgi:hypothetical protein